MRATLMSCCTLFLSTPSARRATLSRSKRSGSVSYFYPRPPRGGRLQVVELASHDLEISIHALREEGDRSASSSMTASSIFLSTPSARRATPSRCSLRSGFVFLSTPSARRATSYTPLANP